MIEVRDADPERWSDVATVMGGRGDAARCWCQYFRLRGAEWRAATTQTNRAALRRQVNASPPPGVLAFLDGDPAGWCAIAPRGSYPRLAHSTVSRATENADDLWSITCFVVPVGARRRGVAAALVPGALDLARRHGAATVEAYPIDTAQRVSASSSELYHGTLSMFRAAGFRVVARPMAGRAVVRRTV